MIARTSFLLPLALTCGCGTVVGADDAGPGEDAAPGDDAGDASADPAIQVSTDSPFLRLHQGGENVVAVDVTRPAGFAGDVAVELTGLPSGVASDPVIVPAGANTANLRLEAVASAPAGGPSQIMLRAAASDGGASPGSRALELYVAGAAGGADLTYGSAGVALVEGARLQLQDRAIDARGRVLVAALYGMDPTSRALVRFARDGSLDASFGDGGLVLESEGEISFTHSVVVTASGIYALHNNFTEPTSVRFVRRYREDGTIDPSFGTGGDVVIDDDVRQLSPWRDRVLAYSDPGRIYALDPAGEISILPMAPADLLNLIEDADGRLIAANYLFGLPPVPLPLARFDGESSAFVPYGSMVPGTDYGLVETHGLRALADGSILVAVRLDAGIAIRVRLLRVTAAGALDASYGQGGEVVVSDQLGSLASIVIDPEGRTVILGDDEVLSAEAPKYLRRYSPGGVLDPSFGDAGQVDLPTGFGSELLHEVDAGRVVTCDSFELAEGDQIRCARFWL